MFRLHRYNPNMLPFGFLGAVANRYSSEQMPHSDVGLITVAPRGSVAGLQVRQLDQPQSGWIAVEELMGPKDIIVFVGQTMTRLTKGIYRPMLHKPVLPPSGDRYSLVFFLRATASTILGNLVLPSQHWPEITVKDLEKDIRYYRNQTRLRYPLLRLL